MSAIATSAPARASVSASARPSPREPPVTSATRPERSISTAIGAILRRSTVGCRAQVRAGLRRHLRDDELHLRGVPWLALDRVARPRPDRRGARPRREHAPPRPRARSGTFVPAPRPASERATMRTSSPSARWTTWYWRTSRSLHERRAQAVRVDGDRPAASAGQREHVVAPAVDARDPVEGRPLGSGAGLELDGIRELVADQRLGAVDEVREQHLAAERPGRHRAGSLRRRPRRSPPRRRACRRGRASRRRSRRPRSRSTPAPASSTRTRSSRRRRR